MNLSESYQTFKRNLRAKYALDLPDLDKCLIWVFGFGILVGLTVKDFLPLLETYRDYNVATQVDVALMENRFKPPQLVAVLPMYQRENMDLDELLILARHIWNGTTGECRSCAHLVDEGLDVWKTWNTGRYGSVQELYDNLSFDLIKRYFEIDRRTNDQERGQPLLSGPLFSAAMNYFHSRIQLDYSHIPSNFYFPRESIGVSVIDPLSPKASKKLDALFARLLRVFCSTIEFDEVIYLNEFETVPRNRTHKNCSELLFDPSIPAYYDLNNGLWAVLPQLERPELVEYIFRLYEPLWTPQPDVETKPILIYPDPSILYYSAFDSIYSSFIFQAPSKKKRGHNVTIRYTVQTRATELRPGHRRTCYEEKPETRYTKCMKLWIVEQCECVPFSYKRGLNVAEDRNLPYCDRSLYSQCNLTRTSVPKDVIEKCMRMCKDACEYISYNWQVSYESYDMEENFTEVQIVLIPRFTTFTDITWTIETTPEQFLAQVVGLLNFYLGISGLSLFAFLILCMDWWRRRKSIDNKARMKKESSVGIVSNEKWNGEMKKYDWKRHEQPGDMAKIRDEMHEEAKALNERVKRLENMLEAKLRF